MRKLILVSVVALLAGCSSTSSTTTAQTASTVSTDIQAGCSAVQTALGVAQQVLKGGANATVTNLAAYANAACPVVNGVVAVAANVAANPSSTAWLNSLAAGLQQAAAPAKS